MVMASTQQAARAAAQLHEAAQEVARVAARRSSQVEGQTGDVGSETSEGANMSTATATRYKGTFHGRAEEVSRGRREVAGYLGDCPVSDDVVLIADELASNCILHTRSRGGSFRVRCELSPGSVRIEVEDMGGPWRQGKPGDRPHGLDIVQALTGPDGWGIETTGDGDRVVWARLSW